LLISLTASLAIIVFFAMTQYIIGDRSCCTYAQGANFEREVKAQDPLPFMRLGEVMWTNEDPNALSLSIETNEPISGNASLRVDVKPAATVEEIVNSSSSVVSTDFIPANDDTYYNYSLDVSAKDVNQLHSKIIYYDLNKSEINDSKIIHSKLIYYDLNSNEILLDFIFGGRDGTFKEKFSNVILPPTGTKYMKVQIWIRESLGKHASYLIDNVKIEKANKLNFSHIRPVLFLH
jgi:hypothetical protein